MAKVPPKDKKKVPVKPGKVAPTPPVGFVTGPDAEGVKNLAKTKLEGSVITLEQAKHAGIEWLLSNETLALHPGARPLPSLVFNYLNFDGSPNVVRPGTEPIRRVRYLMDPPNPPKNYSKYTQADGSDVALYIPRVLDVDWQAIILDPKVTLYITEGELKSLAATIGGMPTLGLGGVSNWRARKKGVDFIRELAAIVWPRRTVVIVFDSDLRGNADVCRELNNLAEMLEERGAYVKTLLLPDAGDDKKVGMDDYILANGADALWHLINSSAMFLSYGKVLWELNEKWAYARDLSRVISRENGVLYGVRDFKDTCTARYTQTTMKPNGEPEFKRTSGAEAWMAWPMRQTVRKKAYVPGAPPLDLVPSEAKNAKLSALTGADPGLLMEADPADAHEFVVCCTASRCSLDVARRFAGQKRQSQPDRFLCSAEGRFFVPAYVSVSAARRGGQGRSGATRSHAQRPIASMARIASTGP